MARTRVDTSRLVAFAEQLGYSATQIQGELRRALAAGTIAALAEARLGMPVFTGEGANSIVSRGIRAVAGRGGVVLEDRVFSPAVQVIIADEGRGAGKAQPPLGPIRRWVELQVGRGEMDLGPRPSASEINRAAFAIAASIARRGLPAHHIFAKAERVAQTVLGVEVERVTDELAGRIG